MPAPGQGAPPKRGLLGPTRLQLQPPGLMASDNSGGMNPLFVGGRAGCGSGSGSGSSQQGLRLNAHAWPHANLWG